MKLGNSLEGTFTPAAFVARLGMHSFEQRRPAAANCPLASWNVTGARALRLNRGSLGGAIQRLRPRPWPFIFFRTTHSCLRQRQISLSAQTIQSLTIWWSLSLSRPMAVRHLRSIVSPAPAAEAGLAYLTAQTPAARCRTGGFLGCKRVCGVSPVPE